MAKHYITCIEKKIIIYTRAVGTNKGTLYIPWKHTRAPRINVRNISWLNIENSIESYNVYLREIN